ncbi:MAG: hypothetical protein K0A93_03065 [Desulfuromonadaceae bacterium]|nr:hypothetical protein [Desulfuromonadaceae bacterium]
MATRRWLLLPLLGICFTLGIPNLTAAAEKQTSIEKIHKETRNLLRTIKTYTVEQKEQAVREIAITLRQLDRQIEELEAQLSARWDTMSAVARKETRQSLAAMRQQRDELAAWSKDFQSSSADSWDHIKEGFSKAYQALDESREKALNDLQGD